MKTLAWRLTHIHYCYLNMEKPCAATGESHPVTNVFQTHDLPSDTVTQYVRAGRSWFAHHPLYNKTVSTELRTDEQFKSHGRKYRATQQVSGKHRRLKGCRVQTEEVWNGEDRRSEKRRNKRESQQVQWQGSEVFSCCQSVKIHRPPCEAVVTLHWIELSQAGWRLLLCVCVRPRRTECEEVKRRLCTRISALCMCARVFMCQCEFVFL